MKLTQIKVCRVRNILQLKRKKSRKFRTPRQRRILEEKLQSMPDTTFFASNHVMINKERVQNDLPFLERKGSLDEVALEHANLMVSKGKVLKNLKEHNVLKLVEKRESPYAPEIGINVYHGRSIQKSHDELMKRKKPKKNILSKQFDSMGFASKKDSNGKLYICQIFARPALVNSPMFQGETGSVVNFKG